MKFISRMAMCLLCLSLILSLCGCRLIEYDYSLKQDPVNITKVEFHRFQYDINYPKTFPIKELELDTGLKMLEEIAALPAYKHFGDSTLDYGKIVVYVTYLDNTGEIIGCWNTAVVNAAGKWSRRGFYFDEGQWNAVIAKYIDLTEEL